MKKVLVTLLVTSAMVVSLAAAAMASNVYVDGLVSGKEKAEITELGATGSAKTDFTSYALGTNLNCGKFLFNLEYAKDNTKATTAGDSDTKSDTINFKAGYTLFGSEQGYLALTAGYHQLKEDLSTNDKINGTIIGLKAATILGEKALLEGSIGYSVSGNYKQDGSADIDTDILMFQVKYSYFFTENFGLGIGYKLNQYKFTTKDDPNDDGNLVDMDVKDTYSGPTVGLIYKF